MGVFRQRIHQFLAWSMFEVAGIGQGFDVGAHLHRNAEELAEGFLFYLPGERIARLLDEVTGLAHAGSWLGFDIVRIDGGDHPACGDLAGDPEYPERSTNLADRHARKTPAT